LLDTPSYPAVWRTKDLAYLELFRAYDIFRAAVALARFGALWRAAEGRGKLRLGRARSPPEVNTLPGTLIPDP
jgi:hypothetical protein